jgi:hypothetical protein
MDIPWANAIKLVEVIAARHGVPGSRSALYDGRRGSIERTTRDANPPNEPPEPQPGWPQAGGIPDLTLPEDPLRVLRRPGRPRKAA